MDKKFSIYTVSDATGELAYSLAVAASRQFKEISAHIVRKRMITTIQDIEAVANEAKNCHGVILFTFVSQQLRRDMLTIAKKMEVVAMDVMGPVLDMLANYFHQLPSDEPGLQYKVAHDYYQRVEAVEFSVRHDDGMNLEGLKQADIILLGISRTSKTPLSIYLAYKGYRCANIPIVKGMPLPPILTEVDPKKLVFLTISPDKLMMMRSTRLKKLGRPESEHYAQLENIREEFQYAREVIKKFPQELAAVDVTGKAIEEIATEIVTKLNL